MNYGVLILAAGASTRMGTSKQLLQIENESLLRKTIKTALAIHPYNCTVVLGAKWEEHYKEIKDLAIDIINNYNWEKGMGSSIKSGIENLLKYDVDAVYILVCDQPYLTHTHLQNLAQNYEQAGVSIVASSYGDTVGVPALFDRSLYETLLQLPDEAGAKQIIIQHSKKAVKFEGGEIDLDTMEDYKNL